MDIVQNGNALDFRIGLNYSIFLKKTNPMNFSISYNHINAPTVFSENSYSKYTFKPFLKTSLVYSPVSPGPIHNWLYSYNGYFLNNSIHIFSITDYIDLKYAIGVGIDNKKDIFFRFGLTFGFVKLNFVYLILNDKTVREQIGNGIEESFNLYINPYKYE